jgi:hypothetical protein
MIRASVTISALPEQHQDILRGIPAEPESGYWCSLKFKLHQYQKVGSFSLDQVLEQLQSAPKGGNWRPGEIELVK